MERRRLGKLVSSSSREPNLLLTKYVAVAALALEALHKQVLPFLLRRLKEDVLNDLPPKIIQDYYCELSDVQKTLYDDFSGSQAKTEAEGVIQAGTASSSKDAPQQHVFQSLQYLRKLCNHPSLILKTNHDAVVSALAKINCKIDGLNDIQHAPKLLALRYGLFLCIYLQRSSAEQATTHRLWHRRQSRGFC